MKTPRSYQLIYAQNVATQTAELAKVLRCDHITYYAALRLALRECENLLRSTGDFDYAQEIYSELMQIEQDKKK